MKFNKTFTINSAISVTIDEMVQDKSSNIAFEFDGYNHMHFMVSGEIKWGDKVTKFEDIPVINREMQWYDTEENYDAECEIEMEYIRDEYESDESGGVGEWYSMQVLNIVENWHD